MSIIHSPLNLLRRFFAWLDKQDLPQSCGCVPVDEEKIKIDRQYSIFKQNRNTQQDSVNSHQR